MSDRTLRLRKPFGRTILLALFALLLLFGLLEGALRVGYLEPQLAQFVPSLGSRHHQLELQLARLHSFVDREGQVDCIFLGSSLVWLGYNPDVFEEVIRRETGQEINCFNLGIEALPASAAGVLAEIIIDKYHPWLLMYGTSARDYAPDLEAEETRVVLDTPWIQYQAGNRTLLGWLYTHSYVFRYAAQLGSIIRVDRDGLREVAANEFDLNGFLPKTRPAQEVHFQVADRAAAQWFQPYRIQRENIVGLQRVIAQRKHGVQVIVVEMPLNQAYYGYFENGKEDYDRFAEEVRSITAAEGVLFLQTSTLPLIPDEGWWDRSHMNWTGADVFSNWLGQRVVQATTAKKVHFPAISTTSH